MSDDHIRPGEFVRHINPTWQRCCGKGKVIRTYLQEYGVNQGELKVEVRWQAPDLCPKRGIYLARNLTKEGVRE